MRLWQWGEKGGNASKGPRLRHGKRPVSSVQWFLTRAESFTGVVNNEDPTIPVQLRPGEHALLVLPTSVLVEPRHPAAHWTGGVGGYSFRVARGNHYQVGSEKGDDPGHTSDDLVALDSGTATVTDSRVVFVGARAAHEWGFDKVLGFHHTEEPPWTAIAVSGGQKISGLRYDPSHVEAFRFSLALGLARFHGAVDSLIADLRQQLNEIDAERPGGVVPQWSPADPQAPAAVQAEPVAAAPTPVAVQETPVAVQPTPVAVQPLPVAEPAPTPAPGTTHAGSSTADAGGRARPDSCRGTTHAGGSTAGDGGRARPHAGSGTAGAGGRARPHAGSGTAHAGSSTSACPWRSPLR